MTEDVYETIRQNMNSIWPLKLPKHKNIMEMLKILWPTKEEAQIIALFQQPLIDQKGPRKIAKLTGMSLEQVNELCDQMAHRGVIFKEGKKYALLPIMPGLYEFYFISRSDTKENLEKVAKLFHEMLDEGLLNEWYNSDYPFFRTIPASSLSEKVVKEIEIDQNITAEHEILIFEDVEKYIKRATSISVVNCACRTTYALAGLSECDKPIDICMALNFASSALDSYGLGKKLSQEEALELLKIAEDHGLVHTIINGAGPDTPMLICNCCSCHCGVLGGLIKYNNPRAFAKSNFRPIIDNLSCVRCEKCVQICPMEAIWHHWPHKDDLSDNFITIKEERCIGCGLCAHHCPKDAILMKKVYHDVPEENLFGVLTKVEAKKQH
ncbi:MAG: 4Fe-4S binding protein [Candidatus Helarchaeota archaeon]